MARPRRSFAPEPRTTPSIPLPDGKTQLRRYYSGERLRSPHGGLLEVVRVQPGAGEREPGRILLECLTSSLRYELVVPAATRSERESIRETQAEGRDPSCPRHGPALRLLRAGTVLVCPACGVGYGRVPA